MQEIQRERQEQELRRLMESHSSPYEEVRSRYLKSNLSVGSKKKGKKGGDFLSFDSGDEHLQEISIHL